MANFETMYGCSFCPTVHGTRYTIGQHQDAFIHEYAVAARPAQEHLRHLHPEGIIRAVRSLGKAGKVRRPRPADAIVTDVASRWKIAVTLNSTEEVRGHMNLDRRDLDAEWWEAFAAAGLAPVDGSDPREGTGWVELEAERREIAQREAEQEEEEERMRDLARILEEEDRIEDERVRAWERHMEQQEMDEEERLREWQRERVVEEEEEEIRENADDVGGIQNEPLQQEVPSRQGTESPELPPPAPVSPAPAPAVSRGNKGKAVEIVISSDTEPDSESSDGDDDNDDPELPAFSQPSTSQTFHINAPSTIQSPGSSNFAPSHMRDPSFSKSGNVRADTVTNTPRRSQRLAGPAPATPEARGEPIADFYLTLVDSGLTLAVAGTDTLQMVLSRFCASTEPDVRSCFKGIAGSGKPPRWMKVEQRVWNDVWDALMWASLRRRCAAVFPVPSVLVEGVWEFQFL